MSETDGSEVPSRADLLLRMTQQLNESTALTLQVDAARTRGDLKSAEHLLERLIAVSKEHLRTALLYNTQYDSPVEIVPILQPLSNALLIQADVIQATGDLHNAEKLRSEALEISRKHLPPSDRAEAERSRASTLVAQGRFNEALVALLTARDLFALENNTIRLAKTTLTIVDLLQWLGDNTRALAELDRASILIAPLVQQTIPEIDDFAAVTAEALKSALLGTQSYSEAGDAVELSSISLSIQLNRGFIKKALGDLDDAEQIFKKLLPQYRSLGTGPAIEYQLAAVMLAKGRFPEALSLAMRLEPAFTSEGMLRPKLAGLLRLQAKALLDGGELEEALNRLERGIQDLTKYYDPDLLWKLQWLKGRVLECSHHTEKALEIYARAIETVNKLRKAPLGYRLDSTYLEDKLELFESAIDLATRSGMARECASFIEMIKSRILTATLSITSDSLAALANDRESQFDEITRRLDALEYTGYREGQTEKLRRRSESLLAERAELLERMRFSDPRWRAMSAPVPFDFQKTSEILATRGQAAISLYYRKERVACVLLWKGKGRVAEIELSSRTRSGIKKYLRNLQPSPSDSPDRTWYDLSGGLGIGARHLVPPELLSEALRAKGLIVVPHGPLHLIPWGGLIFNGRRLFEYTAIGILPNLTCISSLHGEFRDRPSAGLVGPPDYSEMPNLPELPGTKTEMDALSKLYSRHSKILGKPLTGEDATSENFWGLAGLEKAEGGILHIACHGTIEPFEPMNSGLLLTDSKVDAAEIARSQLAYDEVVLSACSTGWRPTDVQGIRLLGDDIVGLPGAFLEAGVKSVLVSIPPANDRAASEFTLQYHGHRLRGKSPLDALQQTQKAMLADKNHMPHTWIGFSAYGGQ